MCADAKNCYKMNSHNITLNFNEICRLCLLKEGEMSSIFAVPLPKRIMSFVSFEIKLNVLPLQIYEGDGFPALICQQCCREVDRSYKFKMKCESSDATLKQFMKKSPEDSEDEGGTEVCNMDNFHMRECVRDIVVPYHYPQGIVVMARMFKTTNTGIKEESADEDSRDMVLKEESGDEESVENTGTSGKLANFGSILPRVEQAGTSQSEKIVILCNVDAFENGLSALRPSFANDTSRKEDKKKRRGGSIQKASRKTRLRRVVKPKKTFPTPAPQIQPPPLFPSVLKKEVDDVDDEDDILGEDKPPFICKICSKSFSKRDNLKKHEIIHKGEKPYLCEECGKSFARKQDLNVHRRYHSGVRPYACSLCDKTFHSYSGLKSHENRHNGIKPFLCNACGKTFVQKSQLTNHERVHTQEKPYSCTLCEKTFTTLTNLKTHQKRHTGINDFAC
ncbi:hypothetical protein ANN_24141, partial [Periplaneta americana]